MQSDQRELSRAVKEAMADPRVLPGIGAIYAALQQSIDQRKPICVLSGRCCHFEKFDHRLYVTTLELADFFARISPNDLPENRAIPQGGCPFQQGTLCGVHATRPFGCRVFFCDETATDWQRKAYEQFHAQIKALHERLVVPYYYIEWREALRAMGYADVTG